MLTMKIARTLQRANNKCPRPTLRQTEPLRHIWRAFRIVTLVISNHKIYRSDLLCFSHDLEKLGVCVIYCRLVELLTWRLFEEDREIFPDVGISLFYLKITDVQFLTIISRSFGSIQLLSAILHLSPFLSLCTWYLTLIMRAFNFRAYKIS